MFRSYIENQPDTICEPIIGGGSKKNENMRDLKFLHNNIEPRNVTISKAEVCFLNIGRAKL